VVDLLILGISVLLNLKVMMNRFIRLDLVFRHVCLSDNRDFYAFNSKAKIL
jgi:hypothetical protein